MITVPDLSSSSLPYLDKLDPKAYSNFLSQITPDWGPNQTHFDFIHLCIDHNIDRRILHYVDALIIVMLRV